MNEFKLSSYLYYAARLVPLILVISCNKNDDTNSTDLSINNYKEPTIIEVEDRDNILDGPVVSIGEQLINLQKNKKNKGLLKVKWSVEFEDLYVPVTIEIIKIRLRDSLFSIISKSKEENLLSEGGKKNIKLELVEQINKKIELENLDNNKVKNIFFEEFTISEDS